jgi:hypothetical protein
MGSGWEPRRGARGGIDAAAALRGSHSERPQNTKIDRLVAATSLEVMENPRIVVLGMRSSVAQGEIGVVDDDENSVVQDRIKSAVDLRREVPLCKFSAPRHSATFSFQNFMYDNQ